MSDKQNVKPSERISRIAIGIDSNTEHHGSNAVIKAILQYLDEQAERNHEKVKEAISEAREELIRIMLKYYGTLERRSPNERD